jgi:eukaryotic-like serine/threonine-protein kinase
LRLLRWLGYACLFGLGVVAGTYVLLRVSLSGTGAVVPPVVGFTLEQAEYQAVRAHLLFAVQEERYDLKSPKGVVVAQNPPAGMSARRGNTLGVVVSKGIERMEVPDLVARRMDEAQIGLRQGGLRLASTAFIHGPGPSQTIVAQDPPPGTIVPRDSDVSVLVSAGPPLHTFVAPDLSGTPAQRAQLELQGYGIQSAALKTLKNPTLAEGTIVGQDPAPGLPFSRLDTVQLTVSQP